MSKSPQVLPPGYQPKRAQPVQMMHDLSPEEQHVQKVVEKHSDYLYNLGALSMGIGLHSSTNKLCIVVYVNQKSPQISALKELDGYPVEIIETGGIVTC